MSLRALALSLALSVPSLSSADSEGSLPVLVRCEACDASSRPAISLAWTGEDGSPWMSTIQAVDWTAGKFSGAMEIDGLLVTFDVPATSVDASTWQLDVVPVVNGGAARPFRAVITLPGYSAGEAVAWPDRQAGPVSFELTPIAQILDDHPTWDPSRSLECEVLIPKSAEAPVTFYAAGEPRAWLFLKAGREAASDGAWIFQFAKPGASALDRLSVPVTAFDEGDAWAFRLPLRAITAETLGPAKAAQPPSLRIGNALMIALDDCPRETR